MGLGSRCPMKSHLPPSLSSMLSDLCAFHGPRGPISTCTLRSVYVLGAGWLLRTPAGSGALPGSDQGQESDHQLQLTPGGSDSVYKSQIAPCLNWEGNPFGNCAYSSMYFIHPDSRKDDQNRCVDTRNINLRPKQVNQSGEWN